MIKALTLTIFLGLVTMAWAWDQAGQSKPAQKPVETPAPNGLPGAMPASLVDPIEKLKTRVSFEKGIEAMTLAEALSVLSDRWGLNLIVDQQAFTEQDVANVEEQRVKLPRLRNVRAARVLNMLLSPIKATYWVNSDYIEITTLEKAAKNLRTDLPQSEPHGAVPPLVNARFVRKPLETVLRELADANDASIILDVRAGESAAAQVSATFRNVPLDTAVRILADMAELKSLVIDGAIYVTSKSNVGEWHEEANQRMNLGGIDPCLQPMGLGTRLPMLIAPRLGQ